MLLATISWENVFGSLAGVCFVAWILRRFDRGEPRDKVAAQSATPEATQFKAAVAQFEQEYAGGYREAERTLLLCVYINEHHSTLMPYVDNMYSVPGQPRVSDAISAYCGTKDAAHILREARHLKMLAGMQGDPRRQIIAINGIAGEFDMYLSRFEDFAGACAGGGPLERTFFPQSHELFKRIQALTYVLPVALEGEPYFDEVKRTLDKGERLHAWTQLLAARERLIAARESSVVSPSGETATGART